MNRKWQLPPAHDSGLRNSFTIAESVVREYAGGSFAPPANLISSVNEYFHDETEATEALQEFASLVGVSSEDSDSSDDPRVQAVLAIGIVIAWASSEPESRYVAFRALVRNSWWLENLWPKVAIAVADKFDGFRESLLYLAGHYFAEAELKLVEKYGIDAGQSTMLDVVWRGHRREAKTDDSSWEWIELLVMLDPNRLFAVMDSTKSLVLINRILDSPEFYSNYGLWENFTLKARESFISDGSWNGALLLPCLIRHGSKTLIHVANSQEYQPTVLEPHVESMLDCFVNTVASRADFLGLFKRWGTWLTRQHLKFADDSAGRKLNLDDQDFFWALAAKIPTPFSPLVSEQLDHSWEPWVYQSMLALLHSNCAENFPQPDVSRFIEEWCVTPTEWNSTKGRLLRLHIGEFYASRPNNYACRVLGYSVALNEGFAGSWIQMWDSSVALREILEFRPTYVESSEWRPSDASDTIRALVDIGLGMLDCTANSQEPFNPDSLKESARLFQALWNATTEMLSIDFYGEDFWATMQQHLIIRRLRWTAEARELIGENYCSWLEQETVPTSQEILALTSSNRVSFISLLPLLVQNGISKLVLKDLINEAEVDLGSIAVSAAKFHNGPERKLKISFQHVKLIEDLT